MEILAPVCVIWLITGEFGEVVRWGRSSEDGSYRVYYERYLNLKALP